MGTRGEMENTRMMLGVSVSRFLSSIGRKKYSKQVFWFSGLLQRMFVSFWAAV